MSLDKISKLLLVFVGLIIFFVSIRGQLYPTVWGDGLEYLQHGQIYGYDRSLTRLDTRQPFFENGTGFIMNGMIRPAIPIFYSFFIVQQNQPTVFNPAGSFIYFYYFVLVILLFFYLLKKLGAGKKTILISLVVLLTCFYFIEYTIFGFKEILLIFFTLTILKLLDDVFNTKHKNILLYSALIGVCMGATVFINFSGIIISGITGLIYVYIYLFSQKPKTAIIANLIMLLLAVAVISGSEIQNDVRFIFSRQNLGFVQKVEERINIPSELISFRSLNAKQSANVMIYIRGKFQGITQIQFYGLIFIFFFYILVYGIIRRIKFSSLEKIILFYMLLFFVIVIDPFFLNPHIDSYVLYLSPKYTIMLVPLAAVIIGAKYSSFETNFKKTNILYLIPPTAIFSFVLIPKINNFLSEILLGWSEAIIGLSNSRSYYIDKFSILLNIFGALSLFLSVLFIYLATVKISEKNKKNILSFLFIVVFFILPFLFFLNNNFPIAKTFASVAKSENAKLKETPLSKELRAVVDANEYINKNIGKDSRLLLMTGTTRRLFSYYIDNYSRFFPLKYEETVSDEGETVRHVKTGNAEYILIPEERLSTYVFDRCTLEIKRFYDLRLLKIINDCA